MLKHGLQCEAVLHLHAKYTTDEQSEGQKASTFWEVVSSLAQWSEK